MKLAGVILAMTAGTAFAQLMPSATVDQLVERLAPAQETKTRSLRNLTPQARSIDLVIQFDFDSANLQDASKPLLNNLAEAMNTDRLASINFRIEGHTDAKGTETYNRQLSNLRAKSVLNYLADKGISKDRLTVEGKGFSDLLYPDKPRAIENRRVRISTWE